MIISSIKKGFQVTSKSAALVLSLSLIGVVWSFLNISLAPKEVTANSTPSVPFLLLGVAVLFTSFFLQAGSLGYLYEKIKQGASSQKTFVNSGLKYYLRLLGLGLFIGVFGIVFVLLALTISASFKTVGTVIGVALAATWVYVVLLLFLSPYIIVAKDQKLIASAKESLDISQKHIWTVVGLALLLVAIGFMIGVVLGLVVGSLSVVMKNRSSEFIFAIFSSVINAYLGVLVTASFTAFYLELNSSQHS